MLTRPVKLPSGPSPASNNLGNVNLASLKRQVAFLPARWLHSAFVAYVVQFDDNRLLSFFIRGPRLSPVDRNSSLFSFQAQHLLKPGFKQLDCLFSFCVSSSLSGSVTLPSNETVQRISFTVSYWYCFEFISVQVKKPLGQLFDLHWHTYNHERK